MEPNVSQAPQSHGAPVDADAVCQVCDAVNTDGVLLCRNCGNNLRDQKLHRLQAELLPPEGESLSTLTIVRGVIAVVGLLVVLVVALKANTIADAVVGSSASDNPVIGLFEGLESIGFDALRDQARNISTSPQLVDAAREAGPVSGSMAGEYVIVGEGAYSTPDILGTAVVEEIDTRMRFAIVLNTGHEIRGWIEPQGTKAFRADWQSTGILAPDNDLFAAAGVAVRQSDGGLECFGQSGMDEFDYTAAAYRLPR